MYIHKLVFLLVSSVILSQMFAAQAIASQSNRVVESMQEMRGHHVIRQQWELSCAAAALATVLRYQHGMPVTERSVALGMINRPEYLQNPELVRARQGFSLLDMKRMTDRIGYMGVGLGQLSFDDLLQRAPVIVPVSTNGYPHFVVFRGATSQRVLLADPAYGNVTMSVKKFMAGWIKYREVGHVGFIVTESGQTSPPGRLRATSAEFTFIK
jgi:predicted double-glycine peptidase